MKYRAVIFDLDGVICHTDQYHYEAWKALAQKLGAPFDERVNNRLRGVSRMESLEIILEGYTGKPLSAEQKQLCAQEKNRRYRELLQKMSPVDLNSEVSDTLRGLRDAGYLLAIGSSSKNARFILERLGLGDFFDAVVDGNQITESKPAPEVFLKAAQALGCKPRECLVVEDAASGAAAASSGGMDCAGIQDAAASPGVTYPLRELSELRGLL